MKLGLSNGEYAIIDEEDFSLVSSRKWRVRPNGGRYPTRYVVTSFRDPVTKKVKSILLHRLLLGVPDGVMVDHVNGDTLDNRRSNLRPCTNSQNQQNSEPRGGSSRFKGVSWSNRKGKWRVAFNWQGKTHFVGNFEDQIEAATAYNTAILPLAGEFARLNPVVK